MPGSQYPPLLLIASPGDGHETEKSMVQLVGVVEDNIGLSNFEIFINDRSLVYSSKLNSERFSALESIFFVAEFI